MYSSCLICHGNLGSNTVLEHCSVGRQFAFDSGTGRLWILCGRCQAWNLTPDYARWEVLEECVRHYERSIRRYSTEHIGLAEIRDGVRLIRIADPETSEFAAWRYGRRFATRRYRALVHSSFTALTAGGILAVGSGVAFGAGAVGLGGYLSLVFVTSITPSGAHIVTRVPISDDRSYDVSRSELRFLRVLRTEGTDWVLDTQLDTVLKGPSLIQALSLVLPFLNRWGGNSKHQGEAIRLIHEQGGSEGYMASLHKRNLQTLHSLTRPERLALEMASNEEVERAALEGKFRLLLAAWREADNIAAIADGLFLPLPVEERFRRLKTRRHDVRQPGVIKHRSHDTEFPHNVG